MAAISQTLPGQMTTQSPLRVKAPRAALVPSPRRRSCTVRAAATGPGPKPKGDLIQNVRQGCDDFLQVISLGKFASGQDDSYSVKHSPRGVQPSKWFCYLVKSANVEGLQEVHKHWRVVNLDACKCSQGADFLFLFKVHTFTCMNCGGLGYEYAELAPLCDDI